MKLKEFPPYALMATALRLKTRARLNSTRRPSVPVIVSLTTIPSRLKQVHLTIRSLMAQTHRPERIILWLNDSLKDQRPDNLAQLEGDLFEIRYSPLTCSHRKLIHTLEAFPESLIATCDDDLMYAPDWLERLYREHQAHPDQIITNRCNLITYDAEGNTLPYRDWKKVPQRGFSHPALMPAGYGGVLYPPGAFRPEVTDPDLFLKLAPKADDLWFKAMSYLNGTQCRRASNPGKKPIPVAGTQGFSLGKTNIKQDQNREQWNALRAHFNFKTPDP